jgi:replicative DNA helicase
MARADAEVASGATARYRPLPTGFRPLDDVLSGGLRPGELLVVGGPFGVGKTIFGLQVARNAVHDHAGAAAMVISYEHDRTHLMSRLLCLESAEHDGENALTLRKLADLALHTGPDQGLISRLSTVPSYRNAVARMEQYAARLLLVKGSGVISTLEVVNRWAQELAAAGKPALLVVDYLQKIPGGKSTQLPEAETITHLAQGLKEVAMSLGIAVLAISASDREGLKAKRMHLADLRGSSALQYEADIGLVFNNKYEIISREHLVYNLSQGEAMRNWIIMSVEKNRAGRAAVDMEYLLDASHFRLVSDGGYVRERLIDERVTLA